MATKAKSDGDTDREIVLNESFDDVTVCVALTKDRLKAFASFQLKEGSEEIDYPVEDLCKFLTTRVSGLILDEESIRVVAGMLSKGQSAQERRIAKGKEPERGRDGKLLLLIKPFLPKSGGDTITVPSDRIGLFDQVEKGDTLARIYPPQPGVPGRNIFGEVVPPEPGQPIEIKINAETVLKQQALNGPFEELVALRAGFMTQLKEEWYIENTLRLKGPLSIRQGDVSFNGIVSIQGDVAKGYEITAREAINVNGSVTQARLRCTNGPVTITGTVLGFLGESLTVKDTISAVAVNHELQNSPYDIMCEGALKAQRLECAHVFAHGDVEVEKEVRHCITRTGGKLTVTKGDLLGGSVVAVMGIEARDIGSVKGASTVITLCTDVESTPDYAVIDKKYRELLKAEEALLIYLGPYGIRRDRVILLAGSYRRKIDNLLRKLDSVRCALDQVSRARGALLEGAQLSQSLPITFQKIFGSGCRVNIGQSHFSSPEDIVGPKSLIFDSEQNVFSLVTPEPPPAPVPPNAKA